jgi:rare lipoprotein A
MRRLAPIVALALLAACGSSPKKGGYYKDDGPGNPPSNLDRIADAKPRAEPLHRFANRPYEVFGKKYVPLSSVQPFHQRGLASWYGQRFHGQKTASGETYDMYAMTAAHPTLPIPSYARVTHVKTGKQVIVRVNDRGPFHSGRVIDLSYAAAHRLGLIGTGSGDVEIDSIVR